jgi:hypothetical protein
MLPPALWWLNYYPKVFSKFQDIFPLRFQFITHKSLTIKHYIKCAAEKGLQMPSILTPFGNKFTSIWLEWNRDFTCNYLNKIQKVNFRCENHHLHLTVKFINSYISTSAYFYILQDDKDNCIQGSPIICTNVRYVYYATNRHVSSAMKWKMVWLSHTRR